MSFCSPRIPKGDQTDSLGRWGLSFDYTLCSSLVAPSSPVSTYQNLLTPEMPLIGVPSPSSLS